MFELYMEACENMQKFFRIYSICISFMMIFHYNFSLSVQKISRSSKSRAVSRKKPAIRKRATTSKTPPKKVPVTRQKPTTPKTAQNDIGRLALQYTNEFRVKNKLKPLTWNQKVADLATEHSKNMAEGKVPFGHDGFHSRVARYPSRAWGAAENVFMTSSNRQVARDAVNGWIKSPGHRKNLLGNYNTCAIGVYKGQRGWYATQLFARF